MQLSVGGGECCEGSMQGAMEIFVVLIKPLIHGEKILAIRAMVGGSVMGDGEASGLTKHKHQKVKHGESVGRLSKRGLGKEPP